MDHLLPDRSDQSWRMETAIKKLIIELPDFRAFEPEWIYAGNAEGALLQECVDVDLESGRCEPFPEGKFKHGMER